MARAVVATFVALLLGGAAGTSRAPPLAGAADGPVLYTLGLSTDPYGNSAVTGFGVAEGVVEGTVTKTQVRGRAFGWGGASWFGGGRIVVSRRWHRSALFVYRQNRLAR